MSIWYEGGGGGSTAFSWPLPPSMSTSPGHSSCPPLVPTVPSEPFTPPKRFVSASRSEAQSSECPAEAAPGDTRHHRYSSGRGVPSTTTCQPQQRAPRARLPVSARARLAKQPSHFEFEWL